MLAGCQLQIIINVEEIHILSRPIDLWLIKQTVSSYFQSTNQKLKIITMEFRLISIPKKSFSRLQTKLRIRL